MDVYILNCPLVFNLSVSTPSLFTLTHYTIVRFLVVRGASLSLCGKRMSCGRRTSPATAGMFSGWPVWRKKAYEDESSAWVALTLGYLLPLSSAFPLPWPFQQLESPVSLLICSPPSHQAYLSEGQTWPFSSLAHKVHCPNLPSPLPPSINSTLFIYYTQTPELLLSWSGSWTPPLYPYLAPPALITLSPFQSEHSESMFHTFLSSELLSLAECLLCNRLWGSCRTLKSEKGKEEYWYFFPNHHKMFQCGIERHRENLHLSNIKVYRPI